VIFQRFVESVFVTTDCIGQIARPILIHTLCRSLSTHIKPLQGLRISFGGHHNLDDLYIAGGHQTFDELYSEQFFSR
jgi:hypothetical protein